MCLGSDQRASCESPKLTRCLGGGGGATGYIALQCRIQTVNFGLFPCLIGDVVDGIALAIVVNLVRFTSQVLGVVDHVWWQRVDEEVRPGRMADVDLLPVHKVSAIIPDTISSPHSE